MFNDALIGALIGGIVGALGMIVIFITRKQKYNKLLTSIANLNAEYTAPFYYASASRYQKSWKVYDSYGILYVIGNTVYFKTNTAATPWAFNLAECRVQQEANWRKLKWFSITTSQGEKYYFDSFKMGAFINNSDETLRALSFINSKLTASATVHKPPPPPPPPAS